MVTATMGQRSEIVSESLVPTVVPRLADQVGACYCEGNYFYVKTTDVYFCEAFFVVNHYGGINNTLNVTDSYVFC